MIYIRKVRVGEPGTHEAHITDVQYSFSTTGTLRRTTRRQVVHNIDAGHTYRAHNDRTHRQADVVAAGSGPSRYLTTAADGAESNNLLALPRF